MKAYRISRWVELSGTLNQLRFRKVLTAMSVGGVDGQWMSREGGLAPQEQAALLQRLRSEGVLIELALPTLDVGRGSHEGYRATSAR